MTNLSPLLLRYPSETVSTSRAVLNPLYRMDEADCVEALRKVWSPSAALEKKIIGTAEDLVLAVRKEERGKSGIEALMMRYDLSTEEGVLLMCLAETLLRVPDKISEKLLIQDKLTSASWESQVGEAHSSFVNFVTWGLAMSGKVLKEHDTHYFHQMWMQLLRKSGEPIIRRAIRKAMKLMSEHFVLGRNIEEAVIRSKEANQLGYAYSYDMLGEAARTAEDAHMYYQAYEHAIEVLGSANEIKEGYLIPSVSVKLSALHPRYELSQYEKVVPILIDRVRTLAIQAKNLNMRLTIDAEEVDRLDMSIDIVEALVADPALADWNGLGLAVQAYQKRALPLIKYLIELASQHHRCIPIRLVKGAYWDTEIKRSQVAGLRDYPVFTRKVNTDISYLACVKQMLNAPNAIYPQFATHNAYSVAAILTLLGDRIKHQRFEFQSLQGMGGALHQHIVEQLKLPCRIYAPVGRHEDLLPYLVRRLLENGANSSFVNRIADKTVPLPDLVESPVVKLSTLSSIRNVRLPLPEMILGDTRQNSLGIDLADDFELSQLSKALCHASKQVWQAAPFLREVTKAMPVLSPADHQCQVGVMELADTVDVQLAIDAGVTIFPEWNALDIHKRADILRKMSDLLEAHMPQLIALTVREAGRTVRNAMMEIREAVDFCRYYAIEAEQHLSDQELPSYTGESDVLRMYGRGIILCISPWNFPVAIFCGQIAAALVTGNAVIAKPAGQTVLIAALVTRLFHEAGVPKSALQLMPGEGHLIGQALIESLHIAGVVFTGSDGTARRIQQTLANRSGPIVPFIAETSGINAMIVDSTALPEQVIRDVIASAFDSAGQRCSALRILFVQEEVADHMLSMLQGAMAELTVGDPMLLSTDVGPVIDRAAKESLDKHVEYLNQQGAKLIHRVSLSDAANTGTFVAPQAYELSNSDFELVNKEVFGPILHVFRYKRSELDQVIDRINSLGYGLTFGIHSRIDTVIDHIQRRIHAGNIYVNRDIIGAVVGVQPFGGSWLSGTGPKAGGPHYLSRFCVESTLTIDTTAVGGNARLMALIDE